MKKQKPTTLKRLGLLSFIPILGLITVTLAFSLSKFIENKTTHMMSILEERYGIKVQVSHSRLSTGEIEFKGIHIGEKAIALVGSVKAKINLNPLTGPVGIGNSVLIDGLKLKVSTAQISTFLSHLKSRTGTQKGSRRSQKRLLLQFKNAEVQVVNDEGKNIFTVRKFNLKPQDESALGFSLQEVYLLEQNLSHLNIYGELRKNKKGQNKVKVRLPQLGEKSEIDFLLAANFSKAMMKWQIEKVPLQFRAKLKPIIHKWPNLKGKSELIFNLAERRIDFKSFSHVQDLHLYNRKISSSPVGPINLSIKAYGQADLSKRSLRVTEGVFASKNNASAPILKASYQLESIQTLNGRQTTTFIDLVKESCSTILSNRPIGLAESLKGFKTSGDISTSIEASITDTDLSTFDLRTHHSTINCKIHQVPKRYSLKKLRNSKFLSARSDGGLTLAPLNVKTGRRIIKYDELPAALKIALVASEDTGFWKHKGFAVSSMIAALKKNLVAGEIKAGGSTISMQTTKNLFLSRGRTLSRKLEEIGLTWYLEKYLTKKRILELYANIIEFGPNIWGAEYAAYKIFNKDIQKLGLKESLFLSTLLPSPQSRFSNVCNNALTQGFLDLMMDRFHRIKGLLNIPTKKLNMAMNRPLYFNPKVFNDTSRCHARPNGVKHIASKKASIKTL